MSVRIAWPHETLAVIAEMTGVAVPDRPNRESKRRFRNHWAAQSSFPDSGALRVVSSAPGLIAALLPESKLVKPPRESPILGYVH